MAQQEVGGAPVVQQRGNGLAVAALVVGIVGAAFGLIPITFFIALVLGVIAVALGGPALRAAYRGRGRKVMAWIGTLLGVLAIVLGIVGAVIVNDVFEDTEQELERIERNLERDLDGR